MASYKDHLQVIKGFCDKSDGKDKLTALIQYACLFISAGEPGNVKKIQASVTAARKIFRIMRPLESLTPVLLQPAFSRKQPLAIDALNKLKALLMATYFAADHVVWAHQISLVADKQVGDRYQKLSLWSWALGSCCTVVSELYAMSTALVTRREGEDDATYQKRVEAARAETSKHLLPLVHAVVQALLAAGLLQQLPFKPRTVGLLGVVASAINCYMLLPASPQKTKTA